MERGERGIKRIKVCFVHVSTPYDECNHYLLQKYTNKNVLQTYTNKNKNYKEQYIDRKGFNLGCQTRTTK